MRALIFFDINGTIVARDERTDLPYYRAIDKCLGLTDGMAGVDNSARSDHDVFQEVLRNHHIAYSTALWQKFLTVFGDCLKSFQTSDIWRQNGDAVPFIKKLVNSQHHLALITGELALAAQFKLEKVGVWQYFNSGGFGDDGLSRFSIAEVALKKATTLYGNDFNEIFVIGDTLLDIKTARHIGAKVISITTGSNSRAELAALKPDYLIDKFSEVEHLFLVSD